MNDLENHLRTALHTHAPSGEVPLAAALRAGRRARLARRLPTVVAGLAVVGTAGALVTSQPNQFELTGDGLTLTHGPGVTQVDGERVDLGDGIQVWRDGQTLFIGYPDGPNAFLDTTDMTAQWDDMGYDTIVFDDPGQTDGSTVVVGSIRGNPTEVTVSIGAATTQATVACFEQTPDWCSYSAVVPTSWPTADTPIDISIK